MYDVSIIKKIFKDESHNFFIQFFRYCFVGGIAWLLDYGIAKIMATIPVLLWNFFARKYLLFHRGKNAKI